MSIDLRTHYLGLELANPLVVSACPLTERLEMLHRMEDAGAAAAVFPSLFEEQIEQEELNAHAFFEHGTESFAEALNYFPDMGHYNLGPGGYLRRLEVARREVAIPIIGSLNGRSTGGWTRYAKRIENAGANALELNLYSVPADPGVSGSEIEKRYVDIVASVRAGITIPLAVKIAPFFSAPMHFVRQLVDAGANGVVLFNRFVHPDIDLEHLRMQPSMHLSRPVECHLSLMWLGLLRGRVQASLAASSGVHSHHEVLKLLLAGADVTMLASAIYVHGPEIITTILANLRQWLHDRAYTSVEQMKGSLSHEHSPDPGSYERAGYVKMITSFTPSVGV